MGRVLLLERVRSWHAIAALKDGVWVPSLHWGLAVQANHMEGFSRGVEGLLVAAEVLQSLGSNPRARCRFTSGLGVAMVMECCSCLADYTRQKDCNKYRIVVRIKFSESRCSLEVISDDAGVRSHVLGAESIEVLWKLIDTDSLYRYGI